jgi:hypothetical protein
MKKRYLILPLLVIAVIYTAYRVQHEPYQNEIDITQVATFSAVPIGFNHDYKSGSALPFSGSAVIEVDNDARPEIFLGGGYIQRDGLFRYQDGRFVDISPESGISKDIGDSTHAAASIDVNRDGYIDLFVARQSGLYLFYNQGGIFHKTKLTVDFAAGEVPVSIALGDINLDGHIDLFVSCFNTIDRLGWFYFNPPQIPATSKLLLNKGDNSFADITEAAGLPLRQNAYTAIFADLNGDNLPDLAVAYQGRPAAIFANLGGGRFKEQVAVLNKTLNLATGIAVGDYNSDGNMDLLFTSTGSTIPTALLRSTQAGEINSSWLLLSNNGNFEFTDVSEQAMLADYELASGAVFSDFNLDGRLDLVVAQNSIRFPPNRVARNPGRLLLQKHNQTFANVTGLALVSNRRYAATPLVADFNDDGYPDLVWVNIGGESQAFINNGGNRGYLKIDLGDLPRALGTRVSVDTTSAEHITAQQIASAGSSSDQTHILTFGLGPQSVVTQVQVRFLSGKSLVIEQPKLNQTISLKPEPLAAPIKIEIEAPPVIAEPQPAEEYTPEVPAESPATAEDEQKIDDDLEELLKMH